MSSPRVLISGAGIAGLSLARSLEKLHIEHVILEKRSTSSHSGSGIALPFNAIQALRKLGLRENVLEDAHQVNEVVYTKNNGSVIARANLLDPPLNQDKFVAMHRSKLHEILLDGIESRIQFETTIHSFEPAPNRVKVTCSNLALSGDYDLVVSAEGIHSTLRQQCFPDEETTIDHNMPNWRFVVDCPTHGLQPLYMLARTELFMAYPLDPDTLYCYGHVYDETGRYGSGNPHEHLRKVFGGFGGPVRELLDRLDDQPVLCSRLQSVKKPYYRKGSVVFVGDAGNACSPLLQQGAASAFEDVICLSEQLAEYPVDRAITMYQRIRAPRVEWVVKTSDGPIKMMKMMRNPVGAFIRDMVVRKKGPLNAHGWKQLAEASTGMSVGGDANREIQTGIKRA